MFGAIIGDIVGSRFEWNNYRAKDFELFHPACRVTDDTVMTLAVAAAMMESAPCYDDLEEKAVYWMQKFGNQYPRAGYGGRFRAWLKEKSPQPYNSWGNGSAMRVSACGYAGNCLEEVMELSRKVSSVTHNHPEGIKGAEAVAVAIFMARTGRSKHEIWEYITTNYYPLDFTLDSIRDSYVFDVSCAGSVPQALQAFFESSDFEDALRNAVSIGGDSDTIAAIATGIAGAYYGVPDELYEQALSYMDSAQQEVLRQFEARYIREIGRFVTFTPEKIKTLKPHEIFVFGSNLAGHHLGGAALTAWRNFGAKWGCGDGLMGQTYAIPTMQGGVETIAPYVDTFIEVVQSRPDLHFYVTRIGCGIAGFDDEEISPLFREALAVSNVSLPESFCRILLD